MQLHISRDVQAQTGLLGGDKGATFTLNARLEVDETEAALIDRFKLEGFAITKQYVNGVEIDGHTVVDLLGGAVSRHDSLLGLMESEQVLVSAFNQLKGLLDYGRQFDEDETVGAGDVPIEMS